MTGTAQVTPAVSRYFDRLLLTRATPKLLHVAYGQVRDLPANNTNVINFRRYGNLSVATTPLDNSEGNTPSGTNFSITDVPCTVHQYGDFVIITDFLVLTTLDPLWVEASEILGDQAGLTLDTLCRDIVWATTTIQYADASSPKVNAAITDITTSDVLTTGDLDIAIATLKTANAEPLTSIVSPDAGYLTTPVNASYVGIIHTVSEAVVSALTGFLPVEQYVRQAGEMLPGEIGKYKQIRFVSSNNGKRYLLAGNGTCNVDGILLLAKNAFGVTRIGGAGLTNIRKEFGSSGTADALNQRASVGWKSTFGSIILNQDFLLKLLYHIV